MAKPLPTDLFPGFELLETGDTAAADSIAIPLTALEGLTTTEANPLTGDGREIMLSLLGALYDNYTTLPSPSARMQVTRGEAITGDTTRRVDFSVSIAVQIPTSTYQVLAEPA
ncbi:MULTISPECIES: hypothetical protein [unclassified Synechocystis]|uniref:hypothetical protein n=1 Tax=unclassified Synechocystis TaxID=2640012 RepID=UPI0003F5ABD2|nr:MULTISPECIES: hypothetical protein [unclassified Synechocystis]AIE73874.1 hypothetical protein D082_13460 [Synechocystis sp. PCC 6714]MCT0252315.1 hypothetical protein [Synechocystis sp. CS-94]